MRKIKYGHLYNLGNYTNETIELEIEVSETISDTEAIIGLFERIESMHNFLRQREDEIHQKLYTQRQIDQLECRKKGIESQINTLKGS